MRPMRAGVLEDEVFGARVLRNEHELRQVSFAPQKCKVLYAVGKTGCTGLKAEECVVAYEKQAIWSSGTTVRKRFTLESEILQVCWVSFTSQAGSQNAAVAVPSAPTAAADAAQQPKISPAAALAASWHARERSVSPLGLHQSAAPSFAGTPAAASAGGPAAVAAVPGHTPAGTAAGVTAATPRLSAADAAKAAAAAAATADGPESVEHAVLCLLLKNSITCVYPSGEVLETPLLQPCHALWPLPSGLLLAGPSESSANLLTHPLEEPLPVVADCSMTSSGGGVAAFAGWSQERVVWSSRELPYVATYNESRGRLHIWHMRPLPPEAAGIGSSFDLPVVSPMAFLQPRTPAAAAAVGSGSPGGGFTGFGSTGGFGSAAGYSPAAYSGSLLGPLAQQAATRNTGASSYANWSMGGGSAAKRSNLRTPQGNLPVAIFNPTPAQNPWASGLGALGVLRPCFSNTTQAQQAMLLPGPDPPVMFKLVCREELVGGAVPHEAVVATDADGCPLLCVLCKGGAQQLLAFRLLGAASTHHSVNLAFNLPAIAAAPIATHFNLPTNHNSSSSSSSHSTTWRLIDLLVLQPNGNLLLYRASYPLAVVTVQLPGTVQIKTAAAAAFGSQQQQQRRESSCTAVDCGGRVNKRASVAGSVGGLSMSEASDMDGGGSDDMALSPGSAVQRGPPLSVLALTPPQQQQQQPRAPNSQIFITDLSSAAGNRFTLHVSSSYARPPNDHPDMGDAAAAAAASGVGLRVRLGLKWCGGLPTQVLQALVEVLPTSVYQQILSGCLQQKDACCGRLTAEWTAIATVILAWAVNPSFLDQRDLGSYQQTSLMMPGRNAAAAAAAGRGGGEARVLGTTVTTPAAATPAAVAAGGAEQVTSDDMEMTTPATSQYPPSAAAAAAAAAWPAIQQQPSPAISDMSVAMSLDSASAVTTGPRIPRGVGGTVPIMHGTPMSVSNIRLASRLQIGSSNAAFSRPDAAADAYFPTAAAAGAGDAAAAAGVGEGVAGLESPGGDTNQQQQQQQGIDQPQQQQQQQQMAPAADSAWQQLLASQQSQQLLRALPCLRPHQQQQQQQQQHAVQSEQQQQNIASFLDLQHRQHVTAVLHALHSVYEDCKITRLKLHQIQMLSPVCWVLAGWLGAETYQEHYERDGSPSDIAAAAKDLCLAAAALAGAPAPVISTAAAGAAATQQQQQQEGSGASLQGSSGLLDPPGDMLQCIRLLLSASGKYAQYLPYLAKIGSSAVQRSCQVIAAYQILASCSNQCAAAIAAAAAAAAAGGAEQQKRPLPPYSSQAFGSPLLESLFSPNAAAAAGNADQISAGSTDPSSAAAAAAAGGGLGRFSAANATDFSGTMQPIRSTMHPSSSSSSSNSNASAAKLEHVILSHSQKLVLLLVQQGWDVLVLDGLSVGVALPLREAISRCRTNPPTGWPIMAYALIGREDVAATLASNSTSAAAAAAPAAADDSTTKPSDPADKTPQSASGFSVRTSAKPGPAVTQQAKQEASIPTAAAAAAGLERQQHLLLPYEQRLLLPSSSSRSDHSRQPHPATDHTASSSSSSGKNITAIRSSRSGSRYWGRGLRAAGSAAAAARSDQTQNLGPATEFAAPIDGMDGLMDRVSALRFGRDDRLAEVRALLSTHMPIVLSITTSESDPDLQSKQQAALLSAAMRTMAMPLGRGALTLGLTQPLPGEQLAVPLLCLSGVVAGPQGDSASGSGRILVSLDLQAAQAAPGAAADVTAWCEFHNGVAAGLKVAPRRRSHHAKQPQHQNSGLQDCSNGSSTLTEAWLPHSKRTVPNYGHAGVLLGLGLQGHLDRLSWTDLYRYLSDQHDATTIGVLLGMSACCRSTADTTVARMLFLHLPARHPNTFPEIELSPHVQAASLLGLGFLYQGSCHRLMTETMLEEIGRTPGVNPSLTNMAGVDTGGATINGASLSALMCVTHDREAYALAAGFGLGLICLGQGSNAPGLADLHLEEKLRSFMDTNKQPQAAAHKKASSEANGKPSGRPHNSNRPHSILDSILGPGVVGLDSVLGDDVTAHAASAGAAGNTIKLDSEQQQQYGISQVVLESPGVNTYVSGPAAAMALMLMYLKTGDTNVAAKFKVPDTVYALDHMRPDMILLMVLGSALIMWDNIAASQDWIVKQLPPLLNYSLPTILDNMLSSAAGNTAAGQQETDSQTRSNTTPDGQTLDWGAIGLAHVHALSGACFAIGLRFAGTCNAAAEALLRQHLLQLLHAKRRAPGGPNDQSVAPVVAAAAAAAAASPSGVGVAMAPAAASVGKLDKQAIENSMCTVLLSLSLVMAGSGHLPTFRLVQALSRRSAAPLRATSTDGQTVGGIAALPAGPGLGTGNLNYGNHLAVSLAAGLLFLSAGRSSISTSNESVAALLIALYPVWPNSPTDHRCHLQAFRHLYVLAAEPRCLRAVDIHSRRHVVVPLEISADTQGLCGPQTQDKPAAPAAAPVPPLQQQQRGVQGLMMGLQQQQQQRPAAPAAVAQQQGDDMVWSPRASSEKPAAQRRLLTAASTDLPAAAAGPQQQLQQQRDRDVLIKRHAPCLLPERDRLKSLRVCGPRYWPVQVYAPTAAAAPAAASGLAGREPSPWQLPSAAGGQRGIQAASRNASSSSSWNQLYLQQRICVKKKAGSLSYVDDPSGVKSLLFKAFYAGSRTVDQRSSSAARPAAAAAASCEQAGDGVQHQQQQEEEEKDSGIDEQETHKGFDIVHLFNTFSADPQIHAFAQLLRSASADTAAAWCKEDGNFSSSSAAAEAAAAFLSFCHGALYECTVEEKTAVLPWYMQLYSLLHSVCASAAALEHTGLIPTEGLGQKTRSNSSLSLGLPLVSRQGLGTASGSLNPAGWTVLLQDLQLAMCYYNSSIAAAAAACRKAAATSCRISGQQQQQEGWQVEALGWVPLLQSGFCDSLWKLLQQHWQRAGLLSSVPSCSIGFSATHLASPSSTSGGNSGSALQRYLSAGSITAAAAVAGDLDASSRYTFEQLLGSCLSLLRIPTAASVRDALAHLQQGQQLPSAGMALVPMLAEQLPDAPGTALVALAAAVQGA